MNKFILVFVTLFSVASFADTFVFEPYVDAQYGCNYLEGLNWRIPVDATSANAALELVKTQVGQKLMVGCNRDIYQCVHNHGDVEPRPVSFETVEKELVVIGGRILNAEATQELLQIGSVIYHRNLRPLPKCKW